MFWNVATKEICLNWLSNLFEAWLPSCLEQKGSDHLHQKPEFDTSGTRAQAHTQMFGKPVPGARKYPKHLLFNMCKRAFYV